MASHVEQHFSYGGGAPRPRDYGERSAVTPLAYYSSVTLAEQEEVQRQLDAVRASAAEKAASLDAVAREHRHQRQAVEAQLEREEAALTEELAGITRVIDRLRVSTEKAFDDDRSAREDADEEIAALRKELASLEVLEDELRLMRDKVTERCAQAAATRATFTAANERSVAELQKAREDAVRVGVEVNRVRAVSPHRGRASHVSFATPRPPNASPPRAARSPVVPRSPPRSPRVASPGVLSQSRVRSPESRVLSPSRRGRDHVASPHRSRPTSPSGASDAPPATRDRTVSPGRPQREPPLMHRLCATGQTDEAVTMLRQRPDVVHSLDADGNTPLHAACSSPHISIELVNALLLEGASTNAKNDDGLTAFHLACLNTADHDVGHSLKKFLLFKAAVPPNQRTARGETAAHLCARHDRHLDALKYLTSAGVDLTVSALTREGDDGIGSPRRRTALEVAQHSGVRARRSADVLKAAS